MDPGGTFLPYKYCPLCGAEGALAECDSEQDFWEAMEDAFKLPKSVVEPIFELWKEDNEGYSKFRDYMEQFRQSGDVLYEEVMKYA